MAELELVAFLVRCPLTITIDQRTGRGDQCRASRRVDAPRPAPGNGIGSPRVYCLSCNGWYDAAHPPAGELLGDGSEGWD